MGDGRLLPVFAVVREKVMGGGGVLSVYWGASCTTLHRKASPKQGVSVPARGDTVRGAGCESGPVGACAPRCPLSPPPSNEGRGQQQATGGRRRRHRVTACGGGSPNSELVGTRLLLYSVMPGVLCGVSHARARVSLTAWCRPWPWCAVPRHTRDRARRCHGVAAADGADAGGSFVPKHCDARRRRRPP